MDTISNWHISQGPENVFAGSLCQYLQAVEKGIWWSCREMYLSVVYVGICRWVAGRSKAWRGDWRCHSSQTSHSVAPPSTSLQTPFTLLSFHNIWGNICRWYFGLQLLFDISSWFEMADALNCLVGEESPLEWNSSQTHRGEFRDSAEASLRLSFFRSNVFVELKEKVQIQYQYHSNSTSYMYMDNSQTPTHRNVAIPILTRFCNELPNWTLVIRYCHWKWITCWTLINCLADSTLQNNWQNPPIYYYRGTDAPTKLRNQRHRNKKQCSPS